MSKSHAARTGAHGGFPRSAACAAVNSASALPCAYPRVACAAASSKNKNVLIPAAAYSSTRCRVAALAVSWETYMPTATAPQACSCATVGFVHA